MEINVQDLIENTYKKTSRFNSSNLFTFIFINIFAFPVLLYSFLLLITMIASDKTADDVGFTGPFHLFPIVSLCILVIYIIFTFLFAKTIFGLKGQTQDVVKILEEEKEEVKNNIAEISKEFVVEDISTEIITHYIGKISNQTRQLILIEKAIKKLK